MTTEQVNQEIKNLPDTNGVSDGYHTFGELYDHRITLYIAFCDLVSRAHAGPQTFAVWRSKAHSGGVVWDGWFILGVEKEAGMQITYHLPIDRWDECDFAETLEKAPDWDGHSSADVLKRIKSFYGAGTGYEDIEDDDVEAAYQQFQANPLPLPSNLTPPAELIKRAKQKEAR